MVGYTHYRAIENINTKNKIVIANRRSPVSVFIGKSRMDMLSKAKTSTVTIGIKAVENEIRKEQNAETVSLGV